MTSNQLGYRQVLPPATAVTLATDTTLDLSSMSQTIGSLSGANSSSVLLGSGTNFSALTFGNASNTTFAGTISGNGSVTKVGWGLDPAFRRERLYRSHHNCRRHSGYWRGQQ